MLVKPGREKSRTDLTYIEVDKPEQAMLQIVQKYFSYSPRLSGQDSSASISPNASVSETASIGKNVVISNGCNLGEGTKIFHNSVLLENVQIGKNSIIYPNVSIRENCVIGDNVIIHSGTVIGSDGFGYSVTSEGKYQKIPQIGNVIIENDVEIGSNVSVDRAALGSTIIRRGTKIDNLVQVAHNVEIGENTAISAQTGIAGSSKIGKNCIFGGQAGVTGHIEICDLVLVGAQSGISKSITTPGKYFGSPAQELSSTLRQVAHVKNLPDYAARLKTLEKEIVELKRLAMNAESGKEK